MADTDQVLNLAAIIREVDGTHSKGAAALAESILNHPRFRAVLAGGPAVPEGREPASAAGGPSDEELNRLLWYEFTTSTGHGERTDPIAFARAVLARWGNPMPSPPADGKALPEGYIDPEHSGDDRALLETFYSACQAEGGTADKVTLRGLRAVLASRANDHCDGVRQSVREAIAEAIGDGAYDCFRVWEAWGVGTMGEDDFASIVGSDERIAEIADAAIDAMRRAALLAIATELENHQ